MEIKAFITHKKAERYSDCQDRFSISDNGLILSLSDGMTSNTLFPEIWAELLSKSYVKCEGKWSDDILNDCKTEWRKAILKKLDERKNRGDKSVWRLENSIAENKSAGATLCGICIDGNNKWIGHVLGDSTIIECKNNKIERICSSEDKPFDNYPDYYDSITFGKGEVKEFNGFIDENTILLLVSDPFSEFLSTHIDDGERYIQEIISLKTHEDFIELVDRWRDEGMHNDDSTLLIVKTSTIDSIEFDNICDLINKENDVEDNEQEIILNIGENNRPEIEAKEAILNIEDIIEKRINQILTLANQCLKESKKKNKKILKQIVELLNQLLIDHGNTSRPS